VRVHYDDDRVLSVLFVQRPGLLWLIPTATVAKHSAPPTSTDVLTVFNGARPTDSKHSPKKTCVSFISNDVTTGVALVTLLMIPMVQNTVFLPTD